MQFSTAVQLEFSDFTAPSVRAVRPSFSWRNHSVSVAVVVSVNCGGTARLSGRVRGLEKA